MIEENFEWESGSDKESLYLYVSKEFKQKWEESKDKQKMFDKYIIQHIEDVKRDIQNGVNCLDEETLLFKASTVKYKQEFAKISQDIEDQSYELWEKMSESRSKVSKNFDNVTNEAKNVIKELEKVEDKITAVYKNMECISPYRFEKMLEIIDKISNMSDKDKKIFNFLIENKGEWM